jgi:hypothetical protein
MFQQNADEVQYCLVSGESIKSQDNYDFMLFDNANRSKVNPMATFCEEPKYI